MKIVIAGGSGQVGAIRCRAFHRDGHEVVVVSRRPIDAPWRVVPWDGATLGEWAKEIDGCDANDETTGVIGDWDNSPRSWAFSVGVARAWEQTLAEADTPGTRKIALRSGLTMSADPGGIFATLLGLVRRGLGGSVAGGRQYVSWIHEVDFVAVVAWLIDHEAMAGAVNVCAPHPLPQAEFMRALRRAAGVAIGLPATRLMASVGALFMQTETELILKSRRVVPGRLLDRGFEFKYPDWPDAAVDLCNRSQKSSHEDHGVAGKT